MNIIRLKSTLKDKDGYNIDVRVVSDSIGQYWRSDDGNTTCIRYKDGTAFGYLNTVEEIDKMLGV